MIIKHKQKITNKQLIYYKKNLTKPNLFTLWYYGSMYKEMLKSFQPKQKVIDSVKLFSSGLEPNVDNFWRWFVKQNMCIVLNFGANTRLKNCCFYDFFGLIVTVFSNLQCFTEKLMVKLVYINLSLKLWCNLYNDFLAQVFANIRQNDPMLSKNVLTFKNKRFNILLRLFYNFTFYCQVLS